MPDIDSPLYEDALEALERQRDAYEHYLEIVDGQRVALQLDNMRMMSRLAERLDRIIAQIQALAPRVAPVHSLFAAGVVDGPRAQHLRDVMTAAAADAALAQASVRGLTKQLLHRRDQVGNELEQLAAATPQSATGSGPETLDTRG